MAYFYISNQNIREKKSERLWQFFIGHFEQRENLQPKNSIWYQVYVDVNEKETHQI